MEVSMAVRRYLAAVGDNLSATTTPYYKGVLERFISALAGRDVGDLGNADLVGAWSALNQGLRPRSQRVYRATICRWLDWCVEQKMLDHHEFRKVKCDGLDAANRPKISLQRFCALLAAAENLDSDYERTRALALLWTAWVCMLRLSEVNGLLADNLRLEDDPPRILIERGKGGRAAWMSVDYTAAAALRAWLIERSRADVPPPPELWCNAGPKRIPMGRNAWPELLQKLAGIAGIDARECKTHGTRRGSATAMLQSGQDIGTVSLNLRHKFIQTTWDYVEANQSRLSEPDVCNWTSIALKGTPHVETDQAPGGTMEMGEMKTKLNEIGSALAELLAASRNKGENA